MRIGNLFTFSDNGRTDDEEDLDRLTDRLSRYRRVQQLRLQGIDCIVGTDWQSQKIGRIFVRGESEGQK